MGIRAYTYRANVSDGAALQLRRQMCVLKVLWNAVLAMRKAHGDYKKGRPQQHGPWWPVESFLRHAVPVDVEPTAASMVKAVTALRQSGLKIRALGALVSFADVGRTQQTECLRTLDKAVRAFFDRLKVSRSAAGYPRFKARVEQMTFQNARIVDGVLCGPGLPEDQIHLVLHRPIEGHIKMGVLKDCRTHWEVTLQCEDVPTRVYPKTDTEIGIDVGVKSFLALSNGETVGALQPFRQAQALLRRAQRKAARSVKVHQKLHGVAYSTACRAVKTSKRWQRKMKRAQRLATHAGNVRKDTHRKLVHTLVERYDRIAVEDLNLRGLGQGFLRKQCLDAGWGQFISLLQERADASDKLVCKVNARGTSQNCSGCGAVVPKTLAERTHRCDACGLTIDRDINAARNVLLRAQQSDWSVVAKVPKRAKLAAKTTLIGSTNSSQEEKPTGLSVSGRGGKGQPQRASAGETPADEASTLSATVPTGVVTGSTLNFYPEQVTEDQAPAHAGSRSGNVSSSNLGSHAPRKGSLKTPSEPRRTIQLSCGWVRRFRVGME